jgi:hypothetical protein
MLVINEGIFRTEDERTTDILNNIALKICQSDSVDKFRDAVKICRTYPSFKEFFPLYYAFYDPKDSIVNKADEGFVYFGMDTLTKDIKIGFTKQSGEKRLKTISQDTGRKMKLLLQIESHPSSELKFHDIFNKYKLDNECEWFKGDKLPLLSIESMRTGLIQGMSELKVFYLAKALLRGESAWSFINSWVEDLERFADGLMIPNQKRLEK